jgi:hypothetical protein
MRPRILKGVLLIVAFTTLGALTTGDATSAASRQSAVVWLKEPTLIVSTIVQGPVRFRHDAAKMAKGEACTTVYLWEPGKTQNEEVVSFHCIPTARKAAPKFTLRTEPNPGIRIWLHPEGVPVRRRYGRARCSVAAQLVERATGTAAARSDRAALADDVRYAPMSSRPCQAA